jgi:hypothetical protein
MSKLHELLAVEGDREKVAKKLTAESIRTMGKENLFTGRTRSLVMFDPDRENDNFVESTPVTTTVDENLEYLMKPLASYWDVVLQKDLSNQNALADLVVDGNVLAKDLPATFLLGMESKLAQLRQLYEAIPTLQPGFTWEVDPQQKDGIFRTRDDQITFKTEKDVEFRVASEATKEHKAQIVQLERTNNVGKYTTAQYSGMLTPADKAARLARIDVLLGAVKQARQRANATEASKAHVGEVLLDFING